MLVRNLYPQLYDIAGQITLAASNTRIRLLISLAEKPLPYETSYLPADIKRYGNVEPDLRNRILVFEAESSFRATVSLYLKQSESIHESKQVLYPNSYYPCE